MTAVSIIKENAPRRFELQTEHETGSKILGINNLPG
jgi:hypothetical protein